MHVKIVQMAEVKIESSGVLDAFDEVIVFEVLMEDNVVAELGNLCLIRKCT